MLSANGGRLPYSLKREVRTVVCWITTVAAESRAPFELTAGVLSMDTSQCAFAADQVKRNVAAGYDTDADRVGRPPGGGAPNRNPMPRALLAPGACASNCRVCAYRLYGATRLRSR